MAKNHALTLSILAAGSAVFTAPVMAEELFAPAVTQDVTLEIEYSRSELATDSGVENLYEEIVDKAFNACVSDGEFMTRVAARTRYDDCATSLVSMAVGQIAAPPLTRRHEVAPLGIAALED